MNCVGAHDANAAAFFRALFGPTRAALKDGATSARADRSALARGLGLDSQQLLRIRAQDFFQARFRQT